VKENSEAARFGMHASTGTFISVKSLVMPAITFFLASFENPFQTYTWTIGISQTPPIPFKRFHAHIYVIPRLPIHPVFSITK